MTISASTTLHDSSQKPTDVRELIVRELRLDLIGPSPSDSDLLDEILPQAPSRWYLTGFLVPIDAPEKQREGDSDSEGDLDSGSDTGGTDDQATPDKASGRRAWRASSMGLSFLLSAEVNSVDVEVSWGEYARYHLSDEDAKVGGNEPDASTDQGERWRRTHRFETRSIDVSQVGRFEADVPSSEGLKIDALVRHVSIRTETGEMQAKAVSVFLVNKKEPNADPKLADEAFIFQVRLEVRSTSGILPRHMLHGLTSNDWDERLADLHYRDVAEYAVGHNVAAEWMLEEGSCKGVVSCSTPLTPVNRVVPNLQIPDFELEMEALGKLSDSAQAKSKLSGAVHGYLAWIKKQHETLKILIPRRKEIADLLLGDAEAAASRIEDGISCLERPEALEAFAIANRAIARAARQRDGQISNRNPGDLDPPRWRPFQLAFILLNLPGITNSVHADREIVDLLFFPTGGGKTEAYLGLAAFTIAYRRITNPGLTGAGLSVLMRYTLRLLTLDQLGRASAVVCALELERLREATFPKRLGEWPIEIGLWVGRAATPNRMGKQGENDPQRMTARTKVRDYKKNTKKPLPVPIRECPWCGTTFGSETFQLVDDQSRPNDAAPTNLRLFCTNRACDFHLSRRALPILTVDESIYRRLPAYLIATVDKFAGMPWTGEIAGFFGGADRVDAGGFLSAATPSGGAKLEKPLLPPDLIIQDELHLISGPLGTMVGVYETAIDYLCSRHDGSQPIRPKIVVSTATIRRARGQVRALFARLDTRIFPPPGPNREDSFFAQSLPVDDPGSRHYLGIAVPGGSPKVLFLRAAVSLMAIAETAWEQAKPDDKNPAEPYMTLLTYFNSLRELGGARRIVEEEIGPRLRRYATRLRVGDTASLKSRDIKYQVVELTSRVRTEDVAEARRRLGSTFKGRKDNDSVDIALATNMISVGLDIARLALMLVSGQPKTASEYIQATSRVGRDPHKPGLVVVLLNINKPRDRSHYERFLGFHSTFYRSVEATSVTPFAPRALDRALAPVVVALARLGLPLFTPLNGARLAQSMRGDLDVVAQAFAERAAVHKDMNGQQQAEIFSDVRQHVARILDYWAQIAREVGEARAELGYQKEAGVARYLLHEVLGSEILPSYWKPFRAPRSLRDVEPSVLIKIKTPDGRTLSEDQDA